MCFGIDLISSFAVWRPSGVVEGLQTPPGTPDGGLEALRGQIESAGPQGSQGVWRPCSTPEDLETPPDTPNRVWRPSGVAQGLQTPPGTPNRVWRPSGVAQGPQGCWGGAPGGNRETVFLSPPIRGQPRNGVSVTSRSPFSVMGDRPSSVGGDLSKKCNMLIYSSRYRRGTPRECVLELI